MHLREPRTWTIWRRPSPAHRNLEPSAVSNREPPAYTKGISVREVIPDSEHVSPHPAARSSKAWFRGRRLTRQGRWSRRRDKRREQRGSTTAPEREERRARSSSSDRTLPRVRVYRTVLVDNLLVREVARYLYLSVCTQQGEEEEEESVQSKI